MDFSGWFSAVVGGLTVGLFAALSEMRLYQSHGMWHKNKFVYLLWHIFWGEVALIGSFTVGIIVEMLIGANSVVDVLSELKMIWLALLMAMFYSVMMIPFGIMLGIANGSILLVRHSTPR